MIIDCKKGQFKIENNYRDAFKLEAFEEKYIEECFDKYVYIVGDISSGILRLKGFDTNPKSKNYFGFIDDYLELSCAMGCPYYVLKRIQSDEEYEHELNDPNEPKNDGFVIHNIVKENFDKESIVLETTPKVKPNIVINPETLNKIPKKELEGDLKEFVIQEQCKQNEKVEVSQSYVSSSPGFVPNQNKNNFNRNKNKSRKRNKNNERN